MRQTPELCLDGEAKRAQAREAAICWSCTTDVHVERSSVRSRSLEFCPTTSFPRPRLIASFVAIWAGGREHPKKKTHRATMRHKRTWLYSVGPATRPALYSPQARTMTACRISMYGTCELSWSRPCAEASMLSQSSKRWLNVEKANLCGIRVGG